MSHSTSPTQAILLLEDGSVHYGKAFGRKGTTSGEICFNTGMTGYQEVFTDPSYYGQVLIMNSVHIGNYGVKDSDVESSGVKIRGLIGRNLEEQFSRIQAKGSLDEYMRANHIVCIEEVDTRSLVAHVRVEGAMNCVISSGFSSSTSRTNGAAGREARTSVKRSLGPTVSITLAATSLPRSQAERPPSW